MRANSESKSRLQSVSANSGCLRDLKTNILKTAPRNKTVATIYLKTIISIIIVIIILHPKKVF